MMDRDGNRSKESQSRNRKESHNVTRDLLCDHILNKKTLNSFSFIFFFIQMKQDFSDIKLVAWMGLNILGQLIKKLKFLNF